MEILETLTEYYLVGTKAAFILGGLSLLIWVLYEIRCRFSSSCTTGTMKCSLGDVPLLLIGSLFMITLLGFFWPLSLYVLVHLIVHRFHKKLILKTHHMEATETVFNSNVNYRG